MIDKILKLFKKNKELVLVCPNCSYEIKFTKVENFVLVKCPKCGENMEINNENILF